MVTVQVKFEVFYPYILHQSEPPTHTNSCHRSNFSQLLSSEFPMQKADISPSALKSPQTLKNLQPVLLSDGPLCSTPMPRHYPVHDAMCCSRGPI